MSSFLPPLYSSSVAASLQHIHSHLPKRHAIKLHAAERARMHYPSPPNNSSAISRLEGIHRTRAIAAHGRRRRRRAKDQWAPLASSILAEAP
jgi:hypothetical protein